MTNNSTKGFSPSDESENSQTEPQPSWREYFSFNTDHKVIGIQYMTTTFFFFLVGGLFAMLIRAELLTPNSDLVDRPFYNGLFTMHGTIMIFLWIIPFNAGLANYLIPLMIGAQDMAFPVLNASRLLDHSPRRYFITIKLLAAFRDCSSWVVVLPTYQSSKSFRSLI